MSFRPVLLAAAVLSLVACGTEPGAASNGTITPATADTAPSCDPGLVVVGGGAPLVSRTAAISFEMENAPDDLAVWVSGTGGKHRGELLHDRGRALVLPQEPWPANSTMTWNIEMCGETFSGTFETGELMRPVTAAELDDDFLGETFAIDLRASAWLSPVAAPRTTMLLGGALLIDVTARDASTITLAITAAQPNNSMGYEPVTDTLPTARNLSLADNPYVAVPIDGLRLPTSHGSVVLRDATLSLGLSPDGLTDGRLTGTLDVSAIGDGDDYLACELLAVDGVECQPCQGGDGVCVPLALDDVFGVTL